MAYAIIQAAVVNDKGRVRGNNEDNFLMNGIFIPRKEINMGKTLQKVWKEGRQIYAVCDGMGGTDAGEEASCMAVSELQKSYQNSEGLCRNEEIVHTFRSLSDQIYADARAHRRNSGTTIAMLTIEGNAMTVSNVGDSRVYRQRAGSLVQVSEDHSEVQRLMKLGLIKPEEVRTHARRHVINQYMGMTPEVRVAPTIQERMEVKAGDVYLLCSDGLTDMVEDSEIERIINAGGDAKRIARQLTDKALQNGGKDNVTVMVLCVQEVRHRAAAAPKKKIGLEQVLTAGQVIVGAGLCLTLIDYIYYLLH